MNGGRSAVDEAVSKAASVEKDTICGICPAGCWLTATLVDGRLTEVRPQEGHPMGMICRLGERAPEMVYSEHRLTTPMRRIRPKPVPVGERADGKAAGAAADADAGTSNDASATSAPQPSLDDFEAISWEEAMSTIAERLQGIKAEYGAEACGIYTGRGSFDLSLCDVFQPQDTAISSASSVLFPFGSPNTFGVGALCYVSMAMIAPHVTMGGMFMNMDSDLEQAELIVVWGTNPATDSPPLVHKQILQARARGAEVIVIDPRRTETVKAADAQWIPIRPGTDGALALAMIETLIEEDLFDEAFARDWCVGFDELRTYVQHFRPEAVAEITGVPAETIRDLARRIHAARGAAPVMYTGLEYSDSGVQAIRATMVLWALAGQLDVPGGRVFRGKGSAFPINRDGLVANPDPRNAIGRDRFPVYSQYRGESHAIALPEAVLDGRPYPIKSLIILGGSIITAWPDPGVWRRTLGGLDFLVTIDRQLTADAAYADIILPATTGFENTSYMTYGPMFRIRERLIEPVGEARNDYRILAELAERLGYGHLYPQTEEEMLDHVLATSGLTPEDVRAAGGQVSMPAHMPEYKKWEKGLLRADGRPGFETPSGKFEIASSILEENGYDALPVYTEPKEGPLSRPDLLGDFPLVFNSGGRVKSDFRSQHHGVPTLSAHSPEPLVVMHPQDAKERGLADGDPVDVVTARGWVRMKARLSEDIIRGAIDANMGGGGPVGPEAWRSANVNVLTDLGAYDPVSGFPVYKALLCDVRPVAEREAGYALPASPWAQGRMLTGTKERQSAGMAMGTATGARTGADPGAANPAAAPARTVYFDHNATTPLRAEVLAAMMPYLTAEQGNPSSIHASGVRAHDAVEASRRLIARVIGSTARRVIFTGGGSEADNLALKGVAQAAARKRGLQGHGDGNGHGHPAPHIVTSSIEHPAILNAAKALEAQGFRVTYLPVTETGLVRPSDLWRAMTPQTVLVSVMLANNETGVVQPIAELAAIAHEHGAYFHTDAVQALGKIVVDIEALGVDLASFSSHKIHGPKGVGALFVRAGTPLDAQINGGKQEGGIRAGTENVPGIVGLAAAADLAVRELAAMDRVRKLRDALEEGITRAVPGSRLNGDRISRLPNTLNMTLPGFRGESLVLRLDRMGMALSSGSACKSGSPDPSHALLALGISPEDAHCSIRLSLGHENEQADVEAFLSALSQVVEEAESAVRFVPCR